MKPRRLLINAIAACALLVQGVAIAWTAPVAMQSPASAPAERANCHMAPANHQAQQNDCCCADQCPCLEMCSAGAGIAARAVRFHASPAIAGRSIAPSAVLLTVALPVLLHPPIA